MTKPEAGMSPLEQRARHWARNLNPGENVSDDVVELRVRHYLAGARAEVESGSYRLGHASTVVRSGLTVVSLDRHLDPEPGVE